MNPKYLIALFAAGFFIFSLTLANAQQENQVWFDLTQYEDYCSELGIADYCNERAFNNLVNDANSGNVDEYINELAYPLSYVYNGPVEIKSIDITVNINGPAVVTAKYLVENTLSEEILTSFNLLRSPLNVEVSENGEAVTLESSSLTWTSYFAANEVKEIQLNFEDNVFDGIYGYNVNLLIENMVPVNHKADTGTFRFVFPEGTRLEECVPDATIVGNEVTWNKADFAPWTNPFNDLICTWSIEETQQPIAQQTTPAKSEGGTNLMLPLLLILVLVVVAVFYFKSKGKKAKKTEEEKPKKKK